MIPALSEAWEWPIMVCVFPAPVAPYAKTVALKPFSTSCTSYFTVWSYTVFVTTFSP